MLTRDQIQEHIDRLDSQIPQQGAEFVISYGGDPASSVDCEIVGNYLGYLRFGIEMLKAAIAEIEPGAGVKIPLAYMEIDKWGLHIRRTIRREDVAPYFERDFAAKFPPRTWGTYATAIGEISLGIFAVVCLVVGFLEVISWIWRLRF